jgi:coproporphyrinogen III oxidase-like Fe-S oxidoreductase
MEETLFTGLRLSAGLDRGNFEADHGVDPWVRHAAVLEPCVASGLVWSIGPRFGLTRRGMLVANEILATFV